MSADSRSRGANGCGCLSGGCLGLVVVLVILLGGIGAVGFIFYQKAREYTSAEPVPVPVYQASPEKLREVSSRVDLFKQMERNPDSKQFFSRVKSLKIQGDHVRIQIIPGTASGSGENYKGFNQQ